jgi:hypothetical protein
MKGRPQNVGYRVKTGLRPFSKTPPASPAAGDPAADNIIFTTAGRLNV